jgi:hypothetical protein
MYHRFVARLPAVQKTLKIVMNHSDSHVDRVEKIMISNVAIGRHLILFESQDSRVDCMMSRQRKYFVDTYLC